MKDFIAEQRELIDGLMLVAMVDAVATSILTQSTRKMAQEIIKAERLQAKAEEKAEQDKFSDLTPEQRELRLSALSDFYSLEMDKRFDADRITPFDRGELQLGLTPSDIGSLSNSYHDVRCLVEPKHKDASFDLEYIAPKHDTCGADGYGGGMNGKDLNEDYSSQDTCFKQVGATISALHKIAKCKK